jgi:hypothetical protein
MKLELGKTYMTRCGTRTVLISERVDGDGFVFHGMINGRWQGWREDGCFGFEPPYNYDLVEVVEEPSKSIEKDLRDEFAIALIPKATDYVEKNSLNGFNIHAVARQAYIFADAFIAARQK